jgi:hypothetical protein
MKLREFQRRMNEAREFLTRTYDYTGNCTSIVSAFSIRYGHGYIMPKYDIGDESITEFITSNHLDYITVEQLFSILFKPIEIKYDTKGNIKSIEDCKEVWWLGDRKFSNLETRLLYLDAFEGYVLSHKLYKGMVPIYY